MKNLSRRLVEAPRYPTRIVQFGEGNFLRGFLDWQVQKMNEAGVFEGGVAIVQPRPGGHVAQLEEQDRLYTVLTEGIENGRTVRRHDIVTVINETVNPYTDWDRFLALAENQDTTIIVSNTTEAGIAIDPSDADGRRAPHGFPAKLTHLMHRRFERHLPGFLVLPCELVDDNGTRLRQTVLQCAHDFAMGSDFEHWIVAENQFCSTLVDRIVPGYPAAQAESLWQEFGYRDLQMVKTEPFSLWVIEGPEELLEELPLRAAGLNAVTTPDLKPYHDRKVYLLNGPHTTMASLARLAGFRTVAEVMADPTFRAFVIAETRQEIVPVIRLPEEELELFADQVVERFDNPSIHHSLDSIALNGVSKFTARLLPILKANVEAGRPLPRRICLALAGLLASYSGWGGEAASPVDSADVIERFSSAGDGDPVRTVLSDEKLWGEDLTRLPGLVELVSQDLARIRNEGVAESVKDLL